MKEEINMAKVELNEKKQIKASVYLKRLNEIETYYAALEKKQDEARAEIGALQDQLKVLNVDYFTVIDEIAANAINNKRRALKDRIADLEMVIQMDVKGIIREKLIKNPEIQVMRQQAKSEFNTFKEELDNEIKELDKQIERIKELEREHKHYLAEQKISELRKNINR
jgi:septal ring factor EnvC (AmiA/AmiB activator)